MSYENNGGYSITLGSHIQKTLNGYSPSWEDEAATSFENWNFEKVTKLKGSRFRADFTFEKLDEDEKKALLTAISPRFINIVCPDYTGQVEISGVSAQLTQANFMGKRYTVSFTAAAMALTNSGGGL